MRNFSIPLAAVICILFTTALSFTLFAWSRSVENQQIPEQAEATPCQEIGLPWDIFSVQYMAGSVLP